jgi:hypothetical protein
MWRPGGPKPKAPGGGAPPPEAPAPKPAISSKLLNMKFMQRRTEKDLLGKLQREEEARAQSARWVAAEQQQGGGSGDAAQSGGDEEDDDTDTHASKKRREPRLELESEAASSAATGGLLGGAGGLRTQSVATAILNFKPARRSFGNFNAKTSAALAAVRDAQATARTALDEAQLAEERRAAAEGGAGHYDPGTVGDEEMAQRCALGRAGRGVRGARVGGGRRRSRGALRLGMGDAGLWQGERAGGEGKGQAKGRGQGKGGAGSSGRGLRARDCKVSAPTVRRTGLPVLRGVHLWALGVSTHAAAACRPSTHPYPHPDPCSSSSPAHCGACARFSHILPPMRAHCALYCLALPTVIPRHPPPATHHTWCRIPIVYDSPLIIT